MERRSSIRIAIVLWVGAAIVSCSAPGPKPIAFGEDACHYCDMTIMERGFACELVTAKGKVHKFDSIECLAAYRYAGSIAPGMVHSQWVSDFNNPGALLDADGATFIYSQQIRSPMAGGLCAVSDQDVAVRVRDSYRGRFVTWNEVCRIVGDAWKVAPASSEGS